MQLKIIKIYSSKTFYFQNKFIKNYFLYIKNYYLYLQIRKIVFTVKNKNIVLETNNPQVDS